MQGSRRTLVLGSLGVALAAALALPAGALAGALTPTSPASPNATDSETAYIVMIVLAVTVGAVVVAGLIAAVRSGRERDGERRTRGTTGIQRAVGVSLGLLAAAAFVFGIIVTESAREVEATGPEGVQTAQINLLPPGEVDPLEIQVAGQQWLWRYQYPDGTFSYYDLVVPVDTAVVLDLQSTDVMHRWWVPALGGMFDAVPGSESKTWFKATETGVYDGASTQYSGQGYATMRARVVVVEAAEYEEWLAQQSADIQEAQAAVAELVTEGEILGTEGS